MIAGFQQGAFQPSFQQGVAVGAGRARGHRYFVEVNGEQFFVATPEQAAELLRQAAIMAKRAAELEAKRAAVAPQAIRKVRDLPKSAPVIKGPPELRREVRQAQKDIRIAYRQAAIDRELYLLFAEEQAEEEATIMLLLN